MDKIAELHDLECRNKEGLSIDLCPCEIAQKWRLVMQQENEIDQSYWEAVKTGL